MGPLQSATARVTDADGAPVAGASVSVESDFVFVGASTDEDGRYQAQVYPGDYRVSFHTVVGRQWARATTLLVSPIGRQVTVTASRLVI